MGKGSTLHQFSSFSFYTLLIERPGKLKPYALDAKSAHFTSPPPFPSKRYRIKFVSSRTAPQRVVVKTTDATNYLLPPSHSCKLGTRSHFWPHRSAILYDWRSDIVSDLRSDTVSDYKSDTLSDFSQTHFMLLLLYERDTINYFIIIQVTI